jgi:hypothetical protein
MRIRECQGPLRDPNTPLVSIFTPSVADSDSESDVSLLAPVILAMPSLTIEFVSLDIPLGCFKYAYYSDVDLNANHINSLLAWSTKGLTLTGSMAFQ